ncbi:DUF7836 family putative zinc-binding protein [Halorhabdus amylolytica]|uniref:DUF7836 family putative zinc-binding protein n=1 Tax=Halorhabdus amylolytica TaxID=2559573 RepID=UPI0010AADECE|nr:hypothetical protein [Halorhabdus amylolytica]
MEEAFVRLLCPECTKEWQSTPRDLPAPQNTFSCPECGERRRLSEFMRTEHDLETLRDLQ